jgi:hemerythrin-like domain-containing protein
LAGKKNQIEISATVIKLTKKCEDGKQIQSKMAEKIVKQEQAISNLTKDCEEGKQIQRKMSENMSEMRNKQVELEDLICDMRKDNGNIWAQHSSGNRAFGRRVSDVVQSAGERKARERELLSQKERTARGPLREKARKAREVTR